MGENYLNQVKLLLFFIVSVEESGYGKFGVGDMYLRGIGGIKDESGRKNSERDSKRTI